MSEELTADIYEPVIAELRIKREMVLEFTRIAEKILKRRWTSPK